MAETVKPIYFSLDRSTLTDEAKSTLAGIGAAMKGHPEIRIVIEGHCDERGTAEYNLALGANRAFAANDYLLSYGIQAARLKTISYGEERPAGLGNDEEAWKQNRRAEFKVHLPEGYSAWERKTF